MTSTDPSMESVFRVALHNQQIAEETIIKFLNTFSGCIQTGMDDEDNDWNNCKTFNQSGIISSSTPFDSLKDLWHLI